MKLTYLSNIQKHVSYETGLKWHKYFVYKFTYKSMFHIQKHANDFWYIMGYALKWLEIYCQMCYKVFETFRKS